MVVSGEAWNSPLFKLNYAHGLRRVRQIELMIVYCRALRARAKESDGLLDNLIELKKHDLKYIICLGHYELFTQITAPLWDDLCDDIFALLVLKSYLKNKIDTNSVSQEDFENEVAKVDREYSNLKDRGSIQSTLERIEQLLLNHSILPPSKQEELIIEEFKPSLKLLAGIRNSLVHRKGRITERDVKGNPDIPLEVGDFYSANVSEYARMWEAADSYHCLIYLRICRSLGIESWMRIEGRNVTSALSILASEFEQNRNLL